MKYHILSYAGRRSIFPTTLKIQLAVTWGHAKKFEIIRCADNTKNFFVIVAGKELAETLDSWLLYNLFEKIDVTTFSTFKQIKEITENDLRVTASLF